MSIVTEIERIKKAKENIINTLKANDIQIEESATIDEVDLIMNDVPILDTSDATATAEDILKDKTAYVNGEKVVGEFEIGKEIIVSATEPTGENRKAIWIQKNVKNLINSPIVFGDAKSRSCYNRAYYYGNAEIKAGESYTFSTNLPTTYQYVVGVAAQKLPAEYGGTVTFVFDSGWKTSDSGSYTFTSPSDGYLAFGIKRTTNEAFDYYVDDISLLNTYKYQLEEGTTATDYEGRIEPKMYLLNENNEYIEFK